MMSTSRSSSPGIKAAGALGPRQPKVTPPTLAVAPDGTVKRQGWLFFPPNTAAPMRLTLTAMATGATLVNEAAQNL